MATRAERAVLGTSALAERARPVTLAYEQLLPVAEPLRPFLPHGGLARGSVVATSGEVAATSLAVALAVEAVARGSWAVAVGLPGLGLAAAHDLGLHLERLAVVAAPPPESWPTVLASLAEGFDVVLAGPPPRVTAAMARRLTARLRERGAVLVQVGWPGTRWPEGPDVVLDAEEAHWEGIGQGWGCCRARRVAVAATGRRGAVRPRRGWLWLPGETGGVATAPPPAEPAASPRLDLVRGPVPRRA